MIYWLTSFTMSGVNKLGSVKFKIRKTATIAGAFRLKI